MLFWRILDICERSFIYSINWFACENHTNNTTAILVKPGNNFNALTILNYINDLPNIFHKGCKLLLLAYYVKGLLPLSIPRNYVFKIYLDQFKHNLARTTIYASTFKIVFNDSTNQPTWSLLL